MRSVSVGEFIIRELGEDDLELLNPVFRTMQQEYQRQYESPSFIPARYFISYPDIKVSTMAANILSEPYELSKIWYKMDSFVETEQMKLGEKIHDELESQGVEVMLDDRKERIGVKFNDRDLIGIPLRITVGKKAGENIIEFSTRKEMENFEMSSEEAINRVLEEVRKIK